MNASLPPPAVATVVDPPRPDEAFARVAHLPHAVWLDSAAQTPDTGDWSFIAADPFGVLRGDDGRATWITPAGVEPLEDPPLRAFARRLESFRAAPAGPMPFDGGAAGFIGYETAGEIERLPASPPRDDGLPNLQLGFYDVVVGWNHRSGECLVVSTGHPASGSEAARRARRRLAETLGWLSGVGPAAVTDWPGAADADPRPVRTRPAGSVVPGRPVGESPDLRSTCSEAEYRASVARLIEAIEAGDVYQVNLSQRFTADTALDALPLYEELRRRSPAPYGAFMRAGATCILSSSPERFLRVWPDGAIETRPIKGTRRRGRTAGEDDRLARALLESEKDRAENLMIVDLLRNDLSRVCRPGTIRVPELFRLESWATVHHLVSIVRGRLRDGVGVDRLLAATFPCGSVTGAPKVRAMELITSLERVARGPYCGALGYFGFGGHVDLSVAIRIAVLREGRATFH
ncbi:MAG: anthranilate synthase component I family protein, partial [Gemmatimonadales bacterium]